MTSSIPSIQNLDSAKFACTDKVQTHKSSYRLPSEVKMLTQKNCSTCLTFKKEFPLKTNAVKKGTHWVAKHPSRSRAPLLKGKATKPKQARTRIVGPYGPKILVIYKIYFFDSQTHYNIYNNINT